MSGLAKKLVQGIFLVLSCSTLAQAAPLTASKETDMREAVDRMTIAAENNGYRLVKVQAVDSALVKRGFEDPGLRILFIGNPVAMEKARTSYPPLLSMLPLRLALIVRGKEIVATSDDLDSWKEMFPEPQAKRLVEEWKRDLELILADFAGR
jgi:uncharacterized protein (DUF302 family)